MILTKEKVKYRVPAAHAPVLIFKIDPAVDNFTVITQSPDGMYLFNFNGIEVDPIYYTKLAVYPSKEFTKIN